MRNNKASVVIVVLPQVIFTGYVSEGRGSRILRSLDFGKSFTPSDLPFEVLVQITYNPENNRVLVVISTLVSAGITSELKPESPVYHLFKFTFPFSHTELVCEFTLMSLLFVPQYDLWLSEDFGLHWRRIHYTVCLVKW